MLVVGPGMMRYDDFTNEDVGNLIMDADDSNTTFFEEEDYDVASFRSIRPQALIGRRNRRKRKRNRNKLEPSHRRPSKKY